MGSFQLNSVVHAAETLDRDFPLLLCPTSLSAKLPSTMTAIGAIYQRGASAAAGRTVVATPNPTEADQLFERLASLKIATSQVAMHLSAAWRTGLFRQLDGLLNDDVWDFSDVMPSDESFRTFLRLITFMPMIRRPMLGANATGNILAGWVNGKDRLTMEFQALDRIRWTVVRQQEGEPEAAAGQTTVRRLPEVLSPYEPAFWMGNQ